MDEKRKFAVILVALLTWSIVVTSLFGYYYLRFQEYTRLSREYEAVTMKVNICIDYGNGTKVWRNNTLVSLGFTLLNTTELIADVDADYTYGPAFINAIDGVENSLEEKKSWFWWHWDTTSSGWMLGEVGADQHMLHRGDIIAWTYQSYGTWPPPPPS